MTRDELKELIAQTVDSTTYAILAEEHLQATAERIIKVLEARTESAENLFDPDKDPSDQVKALAMPWLSDATDEN